MSRTESVRPPIVLLTDFGTRDGYVGVMKGVIASIAPNVPLIDLSHEIPPQDVDSAAFLLGASRRYFPSGSIFVCVVDPGVGSDRRGLIVASDGHWFIGPDNGLFTRVLDGAEARVLDQPGYWLAPVSNTFHGRDVFAPAAGHLASGVSADALGSLIENPVRLRISSPERRDFGWSGSVVYVDRFGNLITDLGEAVLEGNVVCWEAAAGGEVWPMARTYASVGCGEKCGVVGGFGTIELSINRGSASRETGLGPGAAVELRKRTD